MATGSTPTSPQLDGDASTLNLGGLKGGLGRSGPGGLLPAVPHERTRPTSLPAQDSLSGTLGSRTVSVHGSHIQARQGDEEPEAAAAVKAAFVSLEWQRTTAPTSHPLPAPCSYKAK